jgi:hypothetical protein
VQEACGGSGTGVCRGGPSPTPTGFSSKLGTVFVVNLAEVERVCDEEVRTLRHQVQVVN